jgi:uncharacterized RDD family membrane protein YckC
MQPAPDAYPVERAAPRSQPNFAGAVQRSLFPERSASKVIPFESFAPQPAPARPKPRTDTAVKTPTRGTARRAQRAVEGQATLDFLPAEPVKPRTLGTTVEAVIYCEAPVATVLHRAVAAALDWSMVLIGYGLFLLAFRLAGGEFVLNRSNLVVFGGALLLLALTYGLFWSIAGCQTAGMYWTRLRLTTFDGFPPDGKQRLLRFAGSCLSTCSVIGLLWSMADEESLTWQDHISRTFPTPWELDSQVFRRR